MVAYASDSIRPHQPHGKCDWREHSRGFRLLPANAQIMTEKGHSGLKVTVVMVVMADESDVVRVCEVGKRISVGWDRKSKGCRVTWR